MSKTYTTTLSSLLAAAFDARCAQMHISSAEGLRRGAQMFLAPPVLVRTALFDDTVALFDDPVILFDGA